MLCRLNADYADYKNQPEGKPAWIPWRQWFRNKVMEYLNDPNTCLKAECDQLCNGITVDAAASGEIIRDILTGLLTSVPEEIGADLLKDLMDVTLPKRQSENARDLLCKVGLYLPQETVGEMVTRFPAAPILIQQFLSPVFRSMKGNLTADAVTMLIETFKEEGVVNQSTNNNRSATDSAVQQPKRIPAPAGCCRGIKRWRPLANQRCALCNGRCLAMERGCLPQRWHYSVLRGDPTFGR